MPNDPSALGVIRAAICGFVLVEMLLTGFGEFGRLPTTVMRPTGVMQLVPWLIYDGLMTPEAMIAFKVALVVSLAAATVGSFANPATKIAAEIMKRLQDSRAKSLQFARETTADPAAKLGYLRETAVFVSLSPAEQTCRGAARCPR